MGMFDYITSKMPLPDGWSGECQTKDLACDMSQYEIGADNKLRVLEYDLVPDGPRRQHPAFTNWHDWQPYRRENERWRDTEYHGWLNFYGGASRGDWHEYNAKFTDGVCVEIKQQQGEP